MCGILGLAGGRHAEPGLLERLLERLSHRGPDDAAIHRGNGASLGHRRLSIIDLAGGRQPILNETGRMQIVCNGEIYNYAELRRELLDKGHAFTTGSDSEVVLHLFEEEGPACLQRLRGMFAFIIWDEDRQQLFCARDHMGQKPLFYTMTEGGIAVASEIKALLPLLPDGPKPDLRALVQYLSLRVIASPLTMFEGIAKLPPAHSLTFDTRRGLRVERYWQLDYSNKIKGSETELVDALEATMIEAVRLTMVSDVPVGAFLSGGLDSTLVLAMAMRHAAKEPMPTFTIGLPYADYDEAPAARLVARRYGTDHHEATMVPSLRAHLPELVACLDEPSDSLSVCSWLISDMASRHVKVVLGGDGGDELFGGYDRYYGNLYAGWLAMVPEGVRRGVIGPLLDRMPDGQWYKSRSHQLKWLYHASFEKGGERYAESLNYFYIRGEQRAGLFGAPLLDTLKDFDPHAGIATAYETARANHPVDRMLAADSQIRLPDHSVMILDRTAMAHGLEARAPLMDHKLAEFCATLPVSMKVRMRSLRHIQKRLCERYLPPELLTRKKQGFASALPYLLRDEYEQLFAAFLHRSELARAGLLEQAGIDRLRAEHRQGVDHGQRLWLLLNAEAWYRMHIQGMSGASMHALIDEHDSLPADNLAA